MTTWQTLLRDNDPAAAHGARLEPHEVDALRRAAVDAARAPRPAPLRWQQPLAMAAVIVLMIGTGVLAGRRAAERDIVAPPVAASPAQAPGEQQLQFSTPGGTRIIWVFNPEFELKETIP